MPRIHVNGSVIDRARAMDSDSGPYEEVSNSYDSPSAARNDQVILQDDVDAFCLSHGMKLPTPPAFRFPPGLIHYYDQLYNGDSPYHSRTHVMWLTGSRRITNAHFVPLIKFLLPLL